MNENCSTLTELNNEPIPFTKGKTHELVLFHQKNLDWMKIQVGSKSVGCQSGDVAAAPPAPRQPSN